MTEGYHDRPPYRYRNAQLVLFRILSRRDWDRMQSFANSFRGRAEIEHVLYGMYAVHVRPVGKQEAA